MAQTHSSENFFKMGPWHAGVLGPLDLGLELAEGSIQDFECTLGLAHRGLEKILEGKLYYQILPYLSRLDYRAPAHYEYPFVLALEKVLSIQPPLRGQYLRPLVAELYRIENTFFFFERLVSLLSFSGSFVFLKQVRQELVSFLEDFVGPPLQAPIFTVGGLRPDLNLGQIKRLKKTLGLCEKAAKDLQDILLGNLFFKKRTQGLGEATKEDAQEWGLSGVALRAAGVSWDLRKQVPYDVYDQLDFFVPTAQAGDFFARTAVRLQEVLESCAIVWQCLERLPHGPISDKNCIAHPPNKQQLACTLKAMAQHDAFYSKGYTLPMGKIYQAVEGSRGEVGIMIMSEGAASPYRFRIRSASFSNLQALRVLSKKVMLEDLDLLLLSFDLLMTEVER